MILLAILSAIGFGVANGIAQRLVHEQGIARTLFVRSLVASVLLAMLFVVWPHPITLEGLAIALGVNVLGFGAVFAFYRSLGVGVSGIVTPIANSAVIVTLIAAVVFFGESVGLAQYALIALIIAGVILLSHDASNMIARGTGYALLAMVLWGLTYAFIVFPAMMIGPIATPLIGELLAVLIAGLILLARRERVERSSWLPLAGVGVFIVMGVAGFSGAVLSSPVSIVAAISASNPLVTAIYMRVVHGETLSVLQRVGSVLVVIGVVILSVLG